MDDFNVTNGKPEEIQNDINWDYHIFQITLLLTIRQITCIYGQFRMFKHDEFKLNYGPFFVFNNLHILTMVISGQKVYKEPIDDLIAQLLLGLILMLAYLIKSKQYAQVVYQTTILINLSWYARQGTQEEILLWNLVMEYLVCLSPLYFIYRSIQEKDLDFLSRWYIAMNMIESLFWIGTTQLLASSRLSLIPGTIKFLLSLLMLRIYLELRKIPKRKKD